MLWDRGNHLCAVTHASDDMMDVGPATPLTREALAELLAEPDVDSVLQVSIRPALGDDRAPDLSTAIGRTEGAALLSKVHQGRLFLPCCPVEPHGAIVFHGARRRQFVWTDPSQAAVHASYPDMRLGDGTPFDATKNDGDIPTTATTAGTAVCVYSTDTAWFRIQSVSSARMDLTPSMAHVARVTAVAAAGLTLTEVQAALVASRLVVASVPPITRKLAVIVPYRPQPCQSRHLHLRDFVEHMCGHFLPKLRFRAHKVFVIEQSNDGRLFNRGALLNVGARLAVAEGFDTLALHDVDLLPTPCLRSTYECPALCVHAGAAWKRYKYPTYVGGVFIIHSLVFGCANGFPNKFWGWGGEDDRFGERLRAAGYPSTAIHRPPASLPEDAFTDLEERYPGTRSSTCHDFKNMRKWELCKADKDAWRSDGVNSVRFAVISRRAMGEAAVTVVHLLEDE